LSGSGFQASGFRPTAPDSKPDLVLFDAGGTLVLIDPDRFNSFLAGWNQPGVGAESMFTAHFRAMSEYADRLAAGTPLQFRWWIERFFELVGVRLTEEMATSFRGGENMWTHPIRGARETVAELRRRGYRVAVVSNSDGTVTEALDIAGFGGMFEFVIDSSDVGISKPDPGIFDLALRRFALAPERAWYVGDSHYHDVGGARAAGLGSAVLIDPLAIAPVGYPAIRSISDLPGLLV
jgi:putative hydrolase of the HAD superfamily